MAYYYKINESRDIVPPYKGFHLQKVKKGEIPEPHINYDFSKHVLIELLDDVTPEFKLWSEMGLTGNKNIIHKRMMVDSHRIKCRRAVVICVNSEEAKRLAQRLSQMKVMNRCICAVVIDNLLSDLCLFEKQVIQYGDNRSQHQLLYVSDMSRSRGPSGLTKFLKEKFSCFGTILSILVSSDDDGYAYPEGVIKFAYLSEAFAAELAFDQFVVGKERLSVTTHHNILLSQCDLRVRLRDAQWYGNADSNESSESFFRSFSNSYKVNNLETFKNNESVEDSVNDLNISHVNNSKSNDDNSMHSSLDDTIPAFSQYNLNRDSLKEDFDKTLSLQEKQICDKEQNVSNIAPFSRKNLLQDNDVDNAISNNCNITNAPQESKICALDAIPFELSPARVIDYPDKSRFHAKKDIDHLLNVDKGMCKNASDSDSFITCSSTNPNSNALFFSPKKSSYKSLNSQKSDSNIECRSVISPNCKQFSSQLEENLNDTEIIQQFRTKHSKKRKKKFTPSQKLCLKSQKTGQDNVLNTSTQISDSSSSQQEDPQKYKQLVLRKDNLDLPLIADCKNPESPHSSKVDNWLSHLPVPVIEEEELFSKDGIKERDCKNNESSKSLKIENRLLHLPTLSVELSEAVNVLPDLPTNTEFEIFSSKKKINLQSQKFLMDHKNQNRSRISVHKTPALKTNPVMISHHENVNLDNSSVENEDPNKIPLISSNYSDPIVLTNEYNSPLQMWLKQELVSSINNSAFESKEASKSIIVCATKTKDVIISVGCSHMTCDTCYPDSTDLLLGYS